MKNIAEPILTKSGYQQVSEEYRPDVFGSAYSDFKFGAKKVRLIWDGKDGWGYAQIYLRSAANQPGDWQDIDCFLTEGDLESVPVNEGKINEFRIAVSDALKGEI
ncbi:MAG: hypothetical protein KBF52_14970 [Pyrinomonadaceae bacterium]|nr:hypothetical protein [Acidobacteriota bacterium]MBP7476098.1 hypothetical protein [Pyrinomonadaceae bacterium]MBP9937066.1 hypothetical protein [Pyrinomonadaceae bacterium]